jgi:hypothetical protein
MDDDNLQRVSFAGPTAPMTSPPTTPNTRRSAPRQAIGWLEQHAEFRAVASQAQRLLELQADLRRCAPGLPLTALGLEAEELLVGVPTAGAAAKLRQLAPSIARGLRELGWQVKGIRFRPQPATHVAAPGSQRLKDPIPVDALDTLASLAERSTSPALKEALAHLVRTQRRQRGQR